MHKLQSSGDVKDHLGHQNPVHVVRGRPVLKIEGHDSSLLKEGHLALLHGHVDESGWSSGIVKRFHVIKGFHL